MLKTQILFILLLLMPFSAETLEQKTQPMLVEQLSAQLDTLAKNDKQRLPVLTDLIKQTWRISPTQAEEYGKQALVLIDLHSWPEQEASFLVYLSRVYLDRRNLVVAEQMITRGIEAAKKTDNERTLTLNLFNQAILYQNTDKLIFALNTYRELEAIYKRTNNQSALGNLYNNISNIQSKVGDLDAAFESLQMAMPLLKEHASIDKYANSVSNVGRIFFQMQDYSQAERNYKKALSLFDEKSHPKQALETNQLLAVVYNKLGLHENAYQHLKNAERIGELHKLTGKRLVIYYEFVKYYLLLNEIDLADEYINKAQEIVSDTVSDTLVKMLPFYKAKVAAAREKWLEAEVFIDKTMADKSFDQRFFENHEVVRLAVKIKTNLNKTHEANHLLLSVLSDYTEFSVTNNTTFLAQYAELYRTSEKENQIAILKKQAIEQENLRLKEKQASQTLQFIFIVVSLVLITLMLLGMQRSKAIKRENALNLALIQDKKRFFADISHELRTPLTVFKLKMEELEFNLSDNPSEVYALLHNRIDSFNNLINDISLLAQNDKGELELNFEQVELKPLFTNFFSELQTLAKQFNLTATFNDELESDLYSKIDPSRMHQVMVNLFSNSCRYTNSPGEIHFNVFSDNSELTIEIEDSAPGLGHEQRVKIFERLFRADKSRSRKLGGSGLGLSICKDLINAHDGRIVCENSRLGGIKMRINLPMK